MEAKLLDTWEKYISCKQAKTINGIALNLKQLKKYLKK